MLTIVLFVSSERTLVWDFVLIEIPKNLSKSVFEFYLFYLWIVYKYMHDTLLSKVCLISVFLS